MGFVINWNQKQKMPFERMETNMGDIKQTNFRIDQVTADAFRKFCEENGMNQAQGFDHVMQVVEMDKAKAAVPGSAKDIEEFELYVKKIMGAYMKCIEDYNNAKETVREQFASALESKDKMIQALQKKVELSLAEEKVQAYDRITEEKEKTLIEIKELKIEMEQKLLNAQRTMESAIAEKNKELSDAKKDADLALEKAVMEKEREMMEQIRATECENARLVTKLELFIAQNTEK